MRRLGRATICHAHVRDDRPRIVPVPEKIREPSEGLLEAFAPA